MASDDTQCRQAVLGIDIVNTAARAVIAWREGDETQVEVVPFKFVEKPEGHGYHVFEASSDILPFDDDPIKYIRHGFPHDRTKREKLPAMFVPYVLLDKIEYMKEQNPVGIRLKQERSKVGFNNTLFKATVEGATKQFLRFILMCSKKALNKRIQENLQLQIKTVAMAVPSHWNASFQNLYERLLQEVSAEVFEEMDNIKVVFHTDATAIAHYFLHGSSDANGLILRQHGITPDIDTVGGGINTQLFIHCGGHHASSILTTIQRDESGKRVLCEAGRSQGAEGGTEWWLEDLLNYVNNGIVLPTHGSHLSSVAPEDRNHYREIIAQRIRPVMYGFETLDIPPPQGGWRRLIVTQITKERSDQAFHLGFRHIKRMISQQLQRVSDVKRGFDTKEHAVTIIVTGASTDHPAFIKWLEDSCAEQGLPKAITLGTMAQFCGVAQVARGASHATLAQQARNMTASETPRHCIPKFGSEEGRANVRRLEELNFPFLKSLKSGTTADARPDGATKHSPNDNDSLSGEALSSRQMDSESKVPKADTSQAASRKRKASVEPDDVVSAKHVHTTLGLPIRTVSSTTKEPRDVVPANRVHNTRGLAIRTASAARKDASSNGKGGSST